MLSKRIRQVAPIFVGAVAAGLGASQALAALTVDLRVTSVSAGGGTVAPGGKAVTDSVAGATVTMAIWAQVTGSDPSKFQALQSLSGSFLSSNGGLLGNLAATRQSPWNANSSSNGLAVDLDGDGDLDVGSNDPNSADNFFAGRANNLLGPNSTDANGVAVFNATNRQAILGGTEYRVGTLRFVVGSGSPATLVNFRPRQVGTGATWVENATETTVEDSDNPGVFLTSYSGGQTQSPGTGVYAAGAPVSIGVSGGITPEPASLSVIGLAGMGLLARRRKA